MKNTMKNIKAARGYKELYVWREAMAFVPDVYAIVSGFPAHERFALSSQIRRAVISVPANIAEGQARQYPREFVHKLRIARGSLAELHTLLLAAEQVGYVSTEVMQELEHKIGAIARPLSRLLIIVQRRIDNPEAPDEASIIAASPAP